MTNTVCGLNRNQLSPNDSISFMIMEFWCRPFCSFGNLELSKKNLWLLTTFNKNIRTDAIGQGPYPRPRAQFFFIRTDLLISYSNLWRSRRRIIFVSISFCSSIPDNLSTTSFVYRQQHKIIYCTLFAVLGPCWSWRPQAKD